MALAMNEIRRLGRAAGENTATGAFQRLEQAVANFQSRNDASEEETATFRKEAEIAFNRAVAGKYEELAF